MNDGGPAFPRIDGIPYREHGPGYDVVSTNGMSLRDYFAGQALPGVMHIILASISPDNVHDMAKMAYEIADAMLEEGEVKT